MAISAGVLADADGEGIAIEDATGRGAVDAAPGGDSAEEGLDVTSVDEACPARDRTTATAPITTIAIAPAPITTARPPLCPFAPPSRATAPTVVSVANLSPTA
ncbi:MAG: hypothetical protein ACLQBL_07090, partial [Polyangiaceae bacterium]